MISPDRRITRRAALVGASRAAAAVATLACHGQPSGAEPLSREPSRHVIWDVHGHLTGGGDTPAQIAGKLLEYADRMGIERLVVSMGYPLVDEPSPEEVRRQNDQVWQAVTHCGGRVLGLAYLNPKHTRESLDELDRCVRDGPLVGVKLWIAVRCHESCLDPIAERAAQLRAPILQHTWLKVAGNLPGESTPEDLAVLAARHPTASFIAAHTGGDWERGIRAIRVTTNVTAEICGSDPTAGMVEMAVRELGATRVVYGSDFPGRSFASQLAKVHGADLCQQAKQMILAGNIQRMLGPILRAKGISP